MYVCVCVCVLVCVCVCGWRERRDESGEKVLPKTNRFNVVGLFVERELRLHRCGWRQHSDVCACVCVCVYVYVCVCVCVCVWASV